MNKKIALVIVIIILIVTLLSFSYYYTSYKNINMSGYELEVPDSDVQVNVRTDNYNSYDDLDNNLSIKTWAWKNSADLNLSGYADISYQISSNVGIPYKHDNISLMKQSNKYTYVDFDETTAAVIVITSTNIDHITHIVQTMNKTQYKPDIDISSLGITFNGTNINIANPVNYVVDFVEEINQSTVLDTLNDTKNEIINKIDDINQDDIYNQINNMIKG